MSITDSTAVRKGEELNIEAIAGYLRSHLVESFSTIQLEQFPGGHSNLTYLLKIDDREYVLRRPPVGPVAPTAHDMPREYKLLATIHPHFPLAPRPVLLCEDPSVIGVPFYLMERRRGLIVRNKPPAALRDDMAWRQRLSENVVATLVVLHQVNIHETGIVNLGKPAGFVGRQVHGWSERWHRSKTSEVPEMEQAIVWLNERIPDEPISKAAIVHNDFKLDNIMLAEADPFRIVAVLDWEMCSVGDPLIDVGLFLTYWTMTGGDKNSSLRAVTDEPGWFTREQIIEQYEQSSGRDLSRISFYETFARFKIAVVIQQIYFRFVKGQTQDERFRNLDKLVLYLARDAHKCIQRHG